MTDESSFHYLIYLQQMMRSIRFDMLSNWIKRTVPYQTTQAFGEDSLLISPISPIHFIDPISPIDPISFYSSLILNMNNGG